MFTFGQIFKQFRLNKQLNQPEIAKILNVTKGTVSNWENGNRFPDNDMLVKIANFFECSTDYLLGRTNNPNVKIYTGDLNGDKVEIEVNKDYPHELTPDEVKELIDNLSEVGFDVDKLIEKVKNKENKKD